jgi:LytS/YehU family sensor histidine kinase
MLTRMAALLRFSLDSAQPGLVPVQRELNIVRDYLEIEKARFGDRLRYEIAGDEDAGAGSWQREVLVPPLSIQTLVENSIKYAVNARREGALIRVVLKPGDGDCTVEVEDDGPGFGNLALLPGHGLDNLEERLSMLFGERGHLRIRSTGKETSVSFAVPRGSVRKVGGGSSEHEPVTRVFG